MERLAIPAWPIEHDMDATHVKDGRRVKGKLRLEKMRLTEDGKALITGFVRAEGGLSTFTDIPVEIDPYALYSELGRRQAFIGDLLELGQADHPLAGDLPARRQKAIDLLLTIIDNPEVDDAFRAAVPTPLSIDASKLTLGKDFSIGVITSPLVPRDQAFVVNCRGKERVVEKVSHAEARTRLGLPPEPPAPSPPPAMSIANEASAEMTRQANILAKIAEDTVSAIRTGLGIPPDQSVPPDH